MSIDIRILEPGDSGVLECVAEGVFDNLVDPKRANEFLEDARHHLAVALEGEVVVGMTSAVEYFHPDKEPQFWINEVGVAPTHRRQGIARRLLAVILEVAKSLGCAEVWLATENDNEPARRLYRRAGGKEEPIVMYTFELGDGEG